MATKTLRQQGLQWIYPLLMKLNGKNKTVVANLNNIKAMESFYSLTILLNNGTLLSMQSLKGKKILIVNTASDCGFTSQYADLQKLYEIHKGGLEIIAFPSNDFKEQEKGTDEEISQFCQVNFGVTFPLAKKTVVIKSNTQHPVYQWLTSKEKNGWNNQAPQWNFSKYLINEEGVLTNYFNASTAPLSEEVRKAITSPTVKNEF
ncbi:MAG: glutathione peroxidase [Chitinophagaceae bacterium]